MRKYLTTLALSGALLSFDASASGIGILDVERIMKESVAMRDFQSKIEKKEDEYRKEVEKKQSELDAEQKRIEGKRSILSKEAFDKEVSGFDKKLDSLKTFVDRKQSSLKKASIDAMSKLNDNVRDIFSDIAKDRELDIIMPASQAVYYEDKMDVTDDVLKKLNKKITKIDVKFE
jgi:outer membrane protein